VSCENPEPPDFIPEIKVGNEPEKKGKTE
jgi:hypothetical protein